MAYLTPYSIEKEKWTAKIAESRDLIISGLGRLGVGLPLVFQQELARTLEVVNSYYSNRMEGNRTRLGDIFSAQEGRLAKSGLERDYQLEHLAHIQTAETIRTALEKNPSLSPASTEFLRFAHQKFYSALPESLRFATTISGMRVPVIPGELRSAHASIGRHHAVPVDQLEACMMEFEKAYDLRPGFDALIILAAAHHRFLWIHPFSDGNGRVARLMSEAMAIRIGVWGHGLYSISRGLARDRKNYDSALAEADAPRWNDLDGRGNLSLQGLLGFSEFFLGVMADQIQFMGKLIDMPRIYMGLTRMCNILRMDKKLSGSEGVVLLHLLRAGEMRRGDIQKIAGVKQRQANKIAAHLLQEGFVQSNSPKGLLRLKISREMAYSLFPEFYEKPEP